MSNKQQLGAIGLDIGGTKIAAGVVLWPSGEIAHHKLIPTIPARGGEAVLKDTVDLARQLHDWAQTEGLEVAGLGAGPAIARRLVEARPSSENAGMPRDACTAKDVFRVASQGNKAAADILTSAGEALGVSMAFLVNILDPEVIVVGGGLGLAGGLYWE